MQPVVTTSSRDTVMSMMKVICLLLVLLTPSWATQDSPLVRLSHGGAVRGSTMSTRLGKRIFSFRGIPFAKAPVGSLRFQPPVAADHWDGVLDATKDGASCPSLLPVGGNQLVRSEDCLFLNVYTKEVLETKGLKKKPVIVFFHPGGWHSFTSDSRVFGPQYLLDQDVVLVTANYRLGVLGFLSTNDSVVSGNYGLKDQVAALRWIKQNIAAFGGDASSVTITGCSAGAASVMLHMMSPMSRGLFHRVVASSGSALALNTVQPDPFTYAQRLARLFNCSAETSQQIKDCLMTTDAQEMADSILRLAAWGSAPGVIFGPVIETESEGERFLVDHPMKSFLSGDFEQVPFMVGMAKDELGWTASDILRNQTWTRELDTDFERIAPWVFQYERNTPRSLQISRAIRELYFQDKQIDNSTAEQLAKMLRDGIVGYGQDLASKVVSKESKAPLYYYRFSYQGRYSWVYKPGTQVPYGVSHLDDLIYVFYISLLGPPFSEGDPEIKTLERLTTIWANFAKTGNPTPRRNELFQNVVWEPFTTQNLKYLDIGSDLHMKSGLYQDTLPVWDELLYPGHRWRRQTTKG